MHHLKKVLVILICVVSIVTAGCVQPETAGPAATATETVPPPTLPMDTIKTDETGSIHTLIDPNGMTLYYFMNDIRGSGTSACVDQCARTWPPFSVDEIIVSPPLKQDDFTQIIRNDAIVQTTYKGWPLYYYTGDTRFGDLKGDGIDGVWFAVNTSLQ